MNGFQRTLRALALAGGFLCLTTTLAQEPAPEGLVADPTVTFGTLDNGLTYAIMPNEEPPERVSLRLLVRAGSLQETDEQAGLAHFLEHMAFNGSENYAPGELVEYLQRLGMGFGADTNAHTGFNETVYKLELPENSEDYLSEGLQVLSDYAGGLLLLPEEIESERGVIKAELRARDSVGYRTFVSSWNFLLPESRLVNRFPIGEIEVIENAGRDAFVDYYETWYRPDHMAVVVVGEVEPAEIEGMIAEFFADLETPANDVPRIDMGPITNPGLSVGVHAEPEAPATEVALYSLRPFDRGPDSRERRIRRIREGLANAVVSQRLERIARAEGAPISAGVAYAWDYLDYMDVSGIDVTAKPGQWKEAVAVMDEELRRALAFGFQPAELEEAIANRRRAARQAVDTQGTRKSRQLSSALVSALSEERTFLSPEAQLALVEDAINDFGVDEAAETFRALWADDDRFLWMTGPLEAPGDGEPELTEQLQAVYQEASERDVAPPAEVETVPWAYEDFGTAGRISEESHLEDLDIRQVSLTNGIRVNFKQTDFADNSVQVAATFGLGRLGMNEAQQGLDLLASRTFVRGGLQEHDWEEIQRVLAAENVGVSFSVQEDAFYLGGETTPEDFQRQLQLMTAYLSDPAYREESLRNARNSFEQLYVSLAHTPEGVYADRVERFLLNGHWHAGFPPSQRLMMYTMEDVQALLAGPLESAYLEVSIVGDIDWETARPAILRTFGALPERSKTAPRRPEPKVAFPRPVDLAEFEFSSEIPKGRAMVFWPTTDMREDISQSRRLNVLSRMLGDRLRVKVREELGEGYSPYARHSGSEIYPDYGYLVMTNTAAPERLRENAELLATVGNSVAQTPFTEDELTRSLDPLLSFLEEYHRDNSYWLNRVLVGSQARPELLDWARSMQKDYESIRLSDINALAEKYLGGKRDLTVLIAPKPPAASSEATEDEEEQRDGDSSAASQAPSANTEEGDGPSEETEDDAA